MGIPTALVRLAAFVLVVGCLYWAQIVLIPVALAVLITFLLSPPVTWLQRHRVPRVVAILGVVLVALTAVGGLGYVVVSQLLSLSAELPQYESNIRKKVADIRLLSQSSGIERAQETVARAARELDRQAPAPGRGGAPARSESPMPVVIRGEPGSRLSELPGVLAPYLEPLSRAGFVALLVPFMLFAREEMRNRLIRLIGFGRLAVTTRAMDEAGERVTHYLLTQSTVNASFGTLVAGGLFLLGVPYAILFGLLAGALRFVPYVGIWIGAAFPVAISLAQFPGWTRALLVIALFVVMELATASVLEVLLYSRSAGVSQVGLLVALAFWTWIWGPIGLVLATPVTVCLVVFAKYVPELEFVWVIMGDEPAVSPGIAVYQRLLANDEDEAAELVRRALEEQPLDRVYDEVVLPAMLRAGRDHAAGRIDAQEQRVVTDAVRDLLDDLALEPAAPPTRTVYGVPARGEGDAVGLGMLRDVLGAVGIGLEVASPTLLAAELVRGAREHGAGVVVVGALPPGGLSQARYLCKRLKAEVPGVRIVVARWGVPEEGAEAARQALRAAGADAIGTTLAGTRDLIVPLVSLEPETTAARLA